MYTIRRAAEITGVPAATLRAWERRYAVIAPVRTESGYRLYDDASLGEISAMHALVEAGWSARQAAEEIQRRRRAEPTTVTPPAQGERSGIDETGLSLIDRFVAAAAALDGTRLGDVLDEAFSRASFEVVVDGWLMPALRTLGDAWADGGLGIASEHLASHAVLRRLSAAYEAAAQARGGDRVVVGLAPGCRHELGALAFATAARRVGLAVLYVGADLPVDSWLDAVADHRADAAVLAVPTALDRQATTDAALALRRTHPDLAVMVGGAEQALLPSPARHLGHEIGAAAGRLAEQLRAGHAP